MKTDFEPTFLCYQFTLRIDGILRVEKRDKTEDFNWIHHHDDVMRAREFATSNHLCIKCLKKLTAIGHDRKNGKIIKTGQAVNYIKNVIKKSSIKS